jgi:hypothetical protein
MAYLFSLLYMRVELWANYMGIEVRCYWERPKEQLEELHENSMGTYWERGEKNPAHPPPQKKKTGHLMSVC